MATRISYRFGLYLAFLTLALLPGLLGFVFFERHLTAAVRDEFFARTDLVGQGIIDELARREGDLAALAARYAADPALRRALAAGDRLRVETRVRDIFLLSTLDLLEAGDARGTVLARGHRPGDWGENKAGQPIIAAALGGQPAADIESGVSGLALRAVAPVPGPRGTAGTVMTGIRLSADFLRTYRVITGYELALYEGERLIASTAEPPGPLPAGERHQALTAAGREWWAGRVPVRHSTGVLLGDLLLWQDSALVLAAPRATQTSLALVLASGLVLAVVFAWILSRALAAPLRRVLGAMDTVSGGSLFPELPEFRYREFQELATHFTTMVADLRRSRAEIDRTQRQLLTASKLAVLGRVTAELAHEIRNPLNAMEITLRVLRDRLAAHRGCPPEAGDKIELVRAEIRRLNQTLTDFVAAGDELHLRRAPLDPAAETRAVLELARPELESLGIELQADLAPGGMVVGDRTRFQQALRNLVLNACQSMGKGGRVTVTGRTGDRRYLITVSDTGAGMTEEERQRVLDFPFSTKTTGLGCGLAHTVRVVQAHGGEFDLASTPGRGTTVTLAFPTSR